MSSVLDPFWQHFAEVSFNGMVLSVFINQSTNLIIDNYIKKYPIQYSLHFNNVNSKIDRLCILEHKTARNIILWA
ncbi:hypothetical protein [Leptospira kirschneri]|uniref:hypothetical protein n=1 Tax=Leptospira kirschneri TaxID=29507 RepID=UPI00046C636D|nr:hypothetical protein [Leptospira kirschneri]